ncbi:MAG: tetratricopeptide repeat protein [Akkermansiaceae bacterium]|nr:tetratricopeptide repeat protein [Akkermansiaceae bacterium]
MSGKCGLCKSIIGEATPEVWIAPDDDQLLVNRSEKASALAETSVGEIMICEECYVRGLPTYFTPDDLMEIHHQFALDHMHRGEFLLAGESLRKALGQRETADIVSALALTESHLGGPEAAIPLCRRALEIDPGHFNSVRNLQLELERERLNQQE